MSFEWPIYAKTNNNKILTSSSDKVASGCLLVYRNVFTASIPFQGLKKNACAIVNLSVQMAAFTCNEFVWDFGGCPTSGIRNPVKQLDFTAVNSQNISSEGSWDTNGVWFSDHRRSKVSLSSFEAFFQVFFHADRIFKCKTGTIFFVKYESLAFSTGNTKWIWIKIDC